MNIFVARLNYETQSDDLRDVFERYGQVRSAKVIFDHYTGQSRGFGFVEMDDEQAARDAIGELNDSTLDGRRIVVKQARPRNRERNRRDSYVMEKW